MNNCKNLNQTLVEFQQQWGLSVTAFAKVMGIQKSRSSDFLSGKRKEFPPYLIRHLETLSLLDNETCKELIKQRTEAVSGAVEEKGNDSE